MKLGVDFGTTRLVVAAADRGNFPVIQFESPGGGAQDWFPALVAERGGELLYGWEAQAAQQDPSVTVVRSIKRYLRDAGPLTQVDVGRTRIAMIELLAGLCEAMRHALADSSNLKYKQGDPLEVMLGVPANANGNQRFLTAEAFRRAGFHVLGMLNEPSAASIEHGHGASAKHSQNGTLVLVYDLGGGTFDASLVRMDDGSHEVIASEGISSLGGDDFDELLADLALDKAGLSEERDNLPQSEIFRLLEECRCKKEALHPNTRRITIELDQVREGWPVTVVPAGEFYECAHPLILETVHAVHDLLSGNEETIDTLYVTGGASEFPAVPRVLKESFGRRVRRSAYARSSTAIGLAIQADARAGYSLRERFTRHFGVWRESEAGNRAVFDPLFEKGTPLPKADEAPLVVTRRYWPVHNIGHFRYLECSHTSAEGLPAGDITMWDEILFPFDPVLAAQEDLTNVSVHALNGHPGEVEERYHCDSSGAVAVTIASLAADHRRTYRLGRWAQREKPVTPGRKRAHKTRTSGSR